MGDASGEAGPGVAAKPAARISGDSIRASVAAAGRADAAVAKAQGKDPVAAVAHSRTVAQRRTQGGGLMRVELPGCGEVEVLDRDPEGAADVLHDGLFHDGRQIEGTPRYPFPKSSNFIRHTGDAYSVHKQHIQQVRPVNRSFRFTGRVLLKRQLQANLP